MTSAQIRKMVYMAFTAALTVLLAKLTRFPPFPSAPYLKLEFSEIPLLLLCMFGSFPMGLVSLFLKELLSLLFWGTNVFALTADFAACAVFFGCILLLLQKAVRHGAPAGFVPNRSSCAGPRGDSAESADPAAAVRHSDQRRLDADGHPSAVQRTQGAFGRSLCFLPAAVPEKAIDKSFLSPVQ